MKKSKIVIIGDNSLKPVIEDFFKVRKETFEICFSRIKESFISLTASPIPINNKLHNIALQNDRNKEELLYNCCIKDTFNLLIANNPDFVFIDFYSDVLSGVLEICEQTYITNHNYSFEKNPVADSLVISNTLKIVNDFNKYLSLWKHHFDCFIKFMKQYLPNTEIIVNSHAIKYYLDFEKRKEKLSESDIEIIDKALEAMCKYAIEIHKCSDINAENEEGNVVLIQNNKKNKIDTNYNLVINSDFRSGTLYWKKWDKAYFPKSNVLMFNDVTSEKDAWHLLLSNEIEVTSDMVLHLSFECRILDKKLMKDRRIFTIRSWDERHYVGTNNCKDNIEISYEDEKCDGIHFYKYEYSFMSNGRIVSVGPEIRQKGIVEYQNIMLTTEPCDKWNTSYIEQVIVPPCTALVDANREEQLYKYFDEKYQVQQIIESNKTKSISIDCVKSENCFGCGACQNICPCNAIAMKDTLGEGVLYPVIDYDKCVSCGLCAKACPSLKRYNEKIINPKAYAIKNSINISEKSSSAGVFIVLAKYIFSKNGYVCGALYDDKFNVCHTLTNDWEKVLKMRRSKYVQSNIGNVYSDTKKILEQGMFVLFTGTPCQIAGLYTFLGKDYDTLLTMDLICHGVPSPGMWRKYLDENWDTDILKDVNFRYKGNESFYGSQFLQFVLKNGNEIIFDNPEHTFYSAFLKSLLLRSSCENCSYAVKPRAADFSVGDWWGAINVRPDLVDGNKMSITLLNSKKAMEVFSEIQNSFEMVLEISYHQAMNRNRSSFHIDINAERNKFFQLINKSSSFNEAVKKSLFPQYDVIIVGSSLSGNYGAIMTNFALYQATTLAGYNVGVANFQSQNTPKHSLDFLKKYTQLAPSKRNYKEYNWMTDTFLLGSDQLWNYNCFEWMKLAFYLDFAAPDKRRVSYATSFGFDYLTMFEKHEDEYPFANSLIKRFDYISVREQDGVKICDREYSMDASWVLDPVFLIKEYEYAKVARNAVNKTEYKYMTSYFLSAQDQFNKLLLYVSKLLQLPMVNMLTGDPNSFEKQREKSLGIICENLSMEEWLYNIQNSEFVVTDSFHCTCFSIIFRKNFVVIQKGWGLSRLTSLLSMLGLKDRLIGSFEEIKGKEYLLTTPIDYQRVHEILDRKREESLSWLIKSLGASKKVQEHYYIGNRDILDKINQLKNAKTLSEYNTIFSKNKSEYILIVCAHGYNFNREKVNRIMEYIPFYKYSETHSENILKDEFVNVQAEGNNNINCCTKGIKIKEDELVYFRQNPHFVYSISFDWKTVATKGKFCIQLAQSPWDYITEYIEISSNMKSGHYENIYISSSNVKQFELGQLQIRTDNMDGEVIIRNLKIQKGNRPIEKYSDKKIMHGFSLIYDYKNKYLDTSITSIGKLIYQIDDTKILLEYTNEGFRNCKPLSELYVENAYGRDIYPIKKEGVYLMLYSKEEKKIVDISYMNNDSDDEGIIHW